MEGEKVLESYWFRQLVSKHKKLLQTAARENYFVCIPQTCSLISWTIQAKNIENHILAPSTTKRGEFRTLSGRTVTVSGNDIITGNGFTQSVTANILASPVIPVEIPTVMVNDNDTTASSSSSSSSNTTVSANLKVYFLSRPLEGGIAAPSRIDELQGNNVRGYIGFLRSLPDTEPIFTELDEELKIIQYDLLNRGDIPPTERIDNAAKDLNEVCIYIAEALLNTDTFEPSSTGKGKNNKQEDDDHQQIQILQCLESWTTERLHDILLDVLRHQLNTDVTELRTNLNTYMNKTADDFSIKPIFQCNYTPVIEKFKELTKAFTPLEKLHVIRDATLLIHKCVETSLENTNVDISEVEMGADDILPILAWILLLVQKDALNGKSTASTTTTAANTTTSPIGRALKSSSSFTSFAGLSLGSSPRTTSGGPTVGGGTSSSASSANSLFTSDLPLHLSFIQRFHLPGCGELELSLLGYRLANLEQALNYFRTCKTDDEDA